MQAFVRINFGIYVVVGLLLTTAQAADAKCRKESKEEFIKQTSIFVKGRISKADAREVQFGQEITLEIDVLSVLKGTLSQNRITAKYFWANAKEPIRKFERGQTYIIPVIKLAGSKATINASTCPPVLVESDFLNGLRN